MEFEPSCGDNVTHTNWDVHSSFFWCTEVIQIDRGRMHFHIMAAALIAIMGLQNQITTKLKETTMALASTVCINGGRKIIIKKNYIAYLCRRQVHARGQRIGDTIA